MSDTITARGTESKYKAHEAGQFVGQCVDTIDLGGKLQDFLNSTPYIAQSCALVFRTGEINEETGDFIDVAREFTVSMGEKANLKKFLEQWRGKPYTPEQIKQGVPLDKLTGQHGLLTIAHRESAKGRTYANIAACVGVPKQMANAATDYVGGYTRAEYWATKKDDYANEAAAFRAKDSAPGGEWENVKAAVETDDLPF